jgi:hypothetical protein
MPHPVTCQRTRRAVTGAGSVKDNLGDPLVGLDVSAYDNNNNLYEADGYTDANGKYVVGVLGLNGDPWQVGVSSDSSPTNYLFSQPAFDSNNGTNLSVGAAVQVKFTAILATNQIAGFLKDSSGNPIGGVGVWANATINGVDYNQSSVDTDANGNYSLTAANGTWTVGVNTCSDCGDGLPGNYFSPASQTVVISNHNATVNFTAILATNYVTGQVKQASGNPIGGVGVWANATINSVDYYQFADADGNGNYSLNLANGSWTVALECSGGSDSLDNILGSGTYQCPGNQTANIAGNNAVIDFTVRTTVPVMGQPARLSGTQFHFQLSGLASQNYTVQVSTNLAPTNWSTLLTTNLSASPVFIQDNQSTNKQRFYRVRIGP